MNRARRRNAAPSARDPELVRAFIALPLPAEWTAALAATVAQLRSIAPAGVRWANPDGIHLTLQFLGDTDARLIPAIIAALTCHLTGTTAGRTPPVLALSGLGAFPSGDRPRVIWTGVAGDLDILAAIRQSVADATAGLGWTDEKRPFRPHLTLGRVRDNATAAQRRVVADAIAAGPGAVSMPAAGLWRADTVRLYRSVLTPGGGVYASLGEVKIE